MPEEERQTGNAGTDDIDIEIDEPKAGRGRSAWWVIVVIIVLAAVVWYLIQGLEQRARQEREQRAQTYRMEEQNIGRQLDQALQLLSDKKTTEAIGAFAQAESALRMLADQAAGNKDADESARIQSDAAQVNRAMTDIRALEVQLAEAVREKITLVQRTLGVSGQSGKPEAKPGPEAQPGPPATAGPAPMPPVGTAPVPGGAPTGPPLRPLPGPSAVTPAPSVPGPSGPSVPPPGRSPSLPPTGAPVPSPPPGP